MPLMNLNDALRVCEKIFEEAKRSGVKVGCDEYHSHSALDGCLSGDENLKNICKMGETIEMLEDRFQKIKELLIELD